MVTNLARLFATFLLCILFLFIAIPLFAANGAIEVVPKNGDYREDELITAKIAIHGGGTNFNAAEANVAVASNIAVENLVLGDCEFAFVRTPTIQSLSFSGVILGGSKSSCIVYTMTLKPLSGTSGYVFISDASLKSYQGAADILNTVTNSSYTFNASNKLSSQSVIPTNAPIIEGGKQYYTVIYNLEAKNFPEKPNVEVILDPNEPTELVEIPSPLASNPDVLSAVFNKVEQGVHTISVMNNGSEVSKEIVNVQGTNRELTLGAQPKSSNNLLWFAAASLPLVVVIVVVVLLVIFLKRRRY